MQQGVQWLHPQSRFRWAHIPFIQKNKLPDESAASPPAIAQEGSIELLPSDSLPLRMPKAPPDCCPACIEHSLDFSVFDVGAILKMHTAAPSPPMVSFFTEWLNRECAVAKDNVASIRIHDCNMALVVNCACADQSFVDFCFPARMNSHQKQFCGYNHSPPFLCQSLYPVEMPKSPHPCRMTISTNLRNPCRQRLFPSRLVSLFQGARSFACAFLWFSFASLLLPPQEPDWFWGFDQHSVLGWPFFPQCQQTASLLGFGQGDFSWSSAPSFRVMLLDMSRSVSNELERFFTCRDWRRQQREAEADFKDIDLKSNSGSANMKVVLLVGKVGSTRQHTDVSRRDQRRCKIRGDGYCLCHREDDLLVSPCFQPPPWGRTFPDGVL